MRFPMLFLGKAGSREEVCRLALSEGANRRELCRRFRISPTTLYTLLGRYRAEGAAGLVERSRRPHRSPSPDGGGDRAAVLAVRRDNPVWGGREIAGTLRRQGPPSSAFSTVTAILRCHGEPLVSRSQKAWQQFEHAEPNALCQMDFKGHVALVRGRLHPLTVVDDHLRY